MPRPASRVRAPLFPADAAALFSGLAGALTTHPVTPRSEFREELRRRLLATAAGAQGVAAPARPLRVPPGAVRRPHGAWGRRLGPRITAAALATAVAAGSLAVAASRALPGNPFWSIKRAAEGVQFDLTAGEQARGALELEFATTRRGELGPLLAGSPSTGRVVGPVLRLMDAETRSGARLLVGAARSTHSPVPLRTLHRFAAAQAAGIRTLIPAMPADVRQQADHSAAEVLRLDNQATALLLALTGGHPARVGSGGPQAAGKAAPATKRVAVSPAPTVAATPAALPTATPTPTAAATPAATATPTTRAAATPSKTSVVLAPAPQVRSSAPAPTSTATEPASPTPGASGLPQPTPNRGLLATVFCALTGSCGPAEGSSLLPPLP